jgi:hypothetical protein
VAHVLDRKDPAELFQAINKYYTSKTVAKALEIVRSILRVIGDFILEIKEKCALPNYLDYALY